MSVIYFSHSYRKEDASIVQYFAELIKYQQLTIRLDPPSKTVNSAKLERQLKYCDGMIAVLTWRQGGPSQYILYEISLCLRACKPLLVFLEDNLQNNLIPTRILQSRFSRRSFLRQIREHHHFINILKNYLGENPPPKYQPSAMKKTCAMVGTPDLSKEMRENLYSIISDKGYSVIELDSDFEIPIQDQKIFDDIHSADLAVCLIEGKTYATQYLFGALHLAFIPTIFLTTNNLYKYNPIIPKEYQPLSIDINKIQETSEKIYKEIGLYEEDFLDIDDPKKVVTYMQQLLKYASPSGRYREGIGQIIADEVNIAGNIYQIDKQYAQRDIYNVASDLNISQNSSAKDMVKVVDAIKFQVENLNIEEKDIKKIGNFLLNATIELEDKNPNKSSIADSIKQTNDILKEAKTNRDSLRDIGMLVAKAAVWLGTTAAKLGW
jgi:hypothetical protein